MTVTPSPTTARGAYGLSLPESPYQHLLNTGTESWPEWRIHLSGSDSADPRPPQMFDRDRGLLHLAPSGYAEIDRRSATTLVHQTPTPAAAAMIHPLLVSTAVVHADWNGELVFHGGSFLDRRGKAWGVVGSRESGKSSFLAWCAARGIGVVGDDAIVTDGDVIRAGPRCIDLRETAADHFGFGEDIGVVGTRRRWRHQVDPVPLSPPLAGFVALKFDDDASAPGVEHVAVERRAAVLTPHRGFIISQMFPIPWLKVITKPVLAFSRPRDWAAMDDSMGALLDHIDGRGDVR
ncbi:hypothetical protein HQ325_12305 [Rhodococcus sp. BP-349]|uniref:hypothetical protein n=1 Tax=unclassified Rhodococcus (in: high G+C Gram-positive bacteria) TaxID=192944 RepID=UPI001C9A7866|nr:MULTISPECIES: hypothetical protein [unclassified Rhodococcus (in: high G+C Gram-positive bacteria)]MBY6539456.1 hypothetical protein [Rhodococcus sp. BP-363]MBY6544216.1 hypothetical protein [Rhodococcus sp. BP-369]MBY6563446.1 hypothetical protein [Rhodococcus sp. BP-370]MBY6577738.1 hypothetical protein [Rhodococcus sp. BP-364]MBY6587039.1 hypothetical protein [Rhodococcus sp. BP-358]